MKHFLLTLAFCLSFVTAFAEHWKPDTLSYGYQTVINASVALKDVMGTSPDELISESKVVELAAFVNGKCRATTTGVIDEKTGIFHFPLIVKFNGSEDNAVITFKAYYYNVEYDFNKMMNCDGETHGYGSSLEKFYINDVYQFDGGFGMDPVVRLNLTDKKTLDLRSVTYFGLIDDNNQVNKIYLNTIDSYPTINYTCESNNSFFVDGYTITAGFSTEARGYRVYASYTLQNGTVSTDNNGNTPAMVLVEPVISVFNDLSAKDGFLDVAKGGTASILDQIDFYFITDLNEDGSNKVETLSYSDLTTEQKDMLGAPSFNSNGIGTIISISENGTVTGLVPTDIRGVQVSVTFRGAPKAEATVIVRVTPLAYKVVELHLTNPIIYNKDNSSTLDLKQFVSFDVITGYDSDNQAITETKTYNSEDWSAPDLSWECSQVYAGIEKSVLTPYSATDAEGTFLEAWLYTQFESFEAVNGLSCSTTLYITPLKPTFKNVITPEELVFNIDEDGTINLRTSDDVLTYVYYTGITSDGTLQSTNYKYSELPEGAEVPRTFGWEYEGDLLFQINDDLLEPNYSSNTKYPTSYTSSDVKLVINDITQGTIKVYVTPVAYPVTALKLDDIKFDLTDKTAEEVEPIELLSKVKFVTSEGDLTASTPNFKAPTLIWSAIPQGNEYYSIENGKISPIKSTYAHGEEIRASFGKDANDNTLPSAIDVVGKVYVLPYTEYFILRNIELDSSYDYVDIKKGETEDISDYLVYTFATGIEGDEEVTTNYTKSDLIDNGYSLPTLECLKDTTTAISIDGKLITGNRNTNKNGVSITVKTPENRNKQGYIIETDFNVRVTPILYPIKSITITDDISVDLEENETADLTNYLKFEVVVGDSERETAEKTLDDNDWCLPTLSWTTYNNEYYTISDNVLTPVKRTTEDGLELVASIKGAALIYQADATTATTTLRSNAVKVVVEPIVVPLNSFDIVPVNSDKVEFEGDNGVYKALVGDNIILKVKTYPENAEFDIEKLVFEERILDQSIQGWSFGSVEYNNNKLEYSANSVGEATILFTYSDDYTTRSKTAYLNVKNGYEYEMSSGWNWSSYFMLPKNKYNLEDFDALLGGTSTSHVLQDVRSQSSVVYNDPVYGFFGSLDSIRENTMYKIKMNSNASYVEYDKDRYSVSKNYTVKFNNGWTWMPYPYQSAHNLSTFIELGPFNNNEVSTIKILSKSGAYVEYGDDVWSQKDFIFTPGSGYLVYMDKAVTCVWPEEIRLPNDDSALQAPSKRAQSVWSYDVHAFSDVMPVVASITNMDDLDGITVGAFVDGECRGEGYVATLKGKQMLFIGVQGKSGEKVTFKGYDGVDYFELDGTVKFSKMAGSTDAPVELKSALTSGINKINTDVTGAVVTDMNGKVVGTDINALPSGIYLVKDGDSVKKVVK